MQAQAGATLVMRAAFPLQNPWIPSSAKIRLEISIDVARRRGAMPALAASLPLRESATGDDGDDDDRTSSTWSCRLVLMTSRGAVQAAAIKPDTVPLNRARPACSAVVRGPPAVAAVRCRRASWSLHAARQYSMDIQYMDEKGTSRSRDGAKPRYKPCAPSRRRMIRISESIPWLLDADDAPLRDAWMVLTSSRGAVEREAMDRAEAPANAGAHLRSTSRCWDNNRLESSSYVRK